MNCISQSWLIKNTRSMVKDLTYDQAMKRVEAIVRKLEQTEALSVTVYKQKAKEAEELLQFCEAQLVGMERELASKE